MVTQTTETIQPIQCLHCIAIDTMLNSDGDANVKCEQALRLIHTERKRKFPLMFVVFAMICFPFSLRFCPVWTSPKMKNEANARRVRVYSPITFPTLTPTSKTSTLGSASDEQNDVCFKYKLKVELFTINGLVIWSWKQYSLHAGPNVISQPFPIDDD